MEQRKRINASQGAKGEWKLDATVEWTDKEKLIDNHSIAEDSLALIKQTESVYRADGRKIAGDQS